MSAAQQQHVVQFQSITGLGEADCRQRLQSFNWNVEAALDAYFNSNVAPPAVFTPPPPAAVSQVPLVPILAHAAPIPPPPLKADDTFLCGLFPKTAGKGLPASVPLRGLAVKAEVVGMVAQVEVTQRYVNAESAPIEAVFKFRQEECSIYGFEAIVDGEKVVGEIKEKEEALNTYDDAISSGGRGFLLAQDDKVKGAFSLSVGNLPPGKECVVTFRYVSELAVEGDFVRVALPITRLPIHGSDSTTTADTDDVTVKDGLHVTISADMPSPVHAIECPSGHELSTTTKNANTAQVQFDSAKHVSSTGLVVLLGQRQSIGEPQAVVEVDKAAGSAVAMVSFVPQLEHLRDADVIAEVIFVVDRSGSMSGSRINQAKNALALFLHSLPIGTRFNVIGFGSRFEKLFPRSRAYDDSSLEIANRHASGISADLGGTELLAPLRDVLSSPADPQFPRQVFVLTDGEVDNTEDVVACVRKQAKGTRVFTLGIGSDASTELVNGIAKAGKGHAEFVVSGERLEAKVLRQLKRALQPVLKQPTIDYAGGDGGVAVKSHTPDPLPAVFEGERVIAYAFFDTTDTDQIEKAMAGAVLRARTDVEDSENVEFKINAQSSIKEGQLIHRLAARSLIKDLEEAGAEANKGAITELALRYGLVSPFTSFVASVVSDEAALETMRRVDVGDRLTSSLAASAAPVPMAPIRSPIQSHHQPSAKLAQVQQQIDDVKQLMHTNIDRILERGDRLEDMQVRSAELEADAGQFRRSASRMKSGGIFSSIGNALSSVLGLGSGGQSGAANPYAFDADFTPDVNQSAQINSRLSASSDDEEAEESEDLREDSYNEPTEPAEKEKKKEEQADKKQSKIKNKDKSKPARRSTASASATTPFCGAAAKADTAYMDHCFADFSADEPVSAAPCAAPAADPFAGFTFQPAALPSSQAVAPTSNSSYYGFASAPAPAPAPAASAIGRGAAPRPSASAAHMRPLDRFVHHQKANGSWELNENLAQALGRALAELVDSVPAGVSADLWATALALAALDSQFAAEKEEWELLAGKARRWLTRELKKAATSVDALLATAGAFLQA